MSMKTMKAIRLHEFGGPEVLVFEDTLKPELKPGEVLVRVHAVGLGKPSNQGSRTVLHSDVCRT